MAASSLKWIAQQKKTSSYVQIDCLEPLVILEKNNFMVYEL